ncbi:hypothetical protein FSP39_025477 [Pinctada imbricata]|uniref:Outer dense fiber protein 2 n=1 Tax=Pinctada imbricata TaxID=66713 RepID=A0AA89BZZ1_PINIB|nr:hypothetical protein FSP39_025477 [Pinctada imbricata]
MGPRYDKMSKEKSQMLAENSALKTRLEELETLMDRVENSSKVHQENVALQLHDKQSEISGLHSENERLKLKTTTQKLLEMKVREDALAKTLTQRADEFENTNQFVKEIQKEIDSVIEITNSELDEKQEQIICLSTKLTDTQSKLDTSMSCLKSLQREVEGMKSSKDEDIAEKERQVKVLVSQLSEKQKELDQSLDNNSLQRMSCSCVSAEKSGTHSSAESIQKEKSNHNPNNHDNDDLVMKLKEKECEIASLKMSNDQLKVILEEAHKGIRSFQSISSPQKDADDSFSNREISVLKTEIEILKASIHTVETKLHTADEELVQLRGNLKQYENLVEEYKAQGKRVPTVTKANLETPILDSQSQMNRSRREADDTVVQLEVAKKHNERLQHEGEFELEKARICLVLIFIRLNSVLCLEPVKVRLHQRLQELEPLPDMLKSTELRLFESQERMLAYEKKNVENTKLIAELTAKVEHVTEQLDQMRNKYHESQDDNKMLQTKLDGLDRKCRDFEDQNRDIMNNLAKREEALHQTGLRLEEKSRENAGLTRQLENALSDIRRQAEQTRDKASQKERTYQTRISDLESQMSQLRAEMARVKREKEENERKFNSRLYDLKDRLEQSHSTNRSMQNYVQFLKNSYANVFGDSSVSFPSTPMGPGIP